MHVKRFLPTLSLLLVVSLISIPAFAQVEKATFHFDPFYFGDTEANTTRRVLNVYKEELSHIKINTEDKVADIYPDAKIAIDLYEIRKELRNAQNAPKRIDVVVTGELADYIKVYSGAELRPRKVVKTMNGQRFILQEGDALKALLVGIENGESVTLEGSVTGFYEKHLPVLSISKVTETSSLAKSKTTDTPNTKAVKAAKSDA